jgi:hypothetical protein
MAYARRRYESQGAVARQLHDMWWHKTGEWLDPEVWDPIMAGWVKEFRQPILVDAVQLVVAAAVRKGAVAKIDDLPRFAKVLHEDDIEPGRGQCYLVRGRMRSKYRLVEEDDPLLLQVLIRAMRKGVTIDAMYEAIAEQSTLRDCLYYLGIDPNEYQDLGKQKSELIFLDGDSAEFALWDAYSRRTTGRGIPLNSRGGWYFPTRLPPPLEVKKKS